MENYRDTVLSQFKNSPSLGQLIASLNGYIDPTVNLDQFYNNLWNIDTAVGYGLDVLGRIIGVSRVLNIASPQVLGFEEALPGSYALNEGILYSGGLTTSAFPLEDEAYRLLLLAKAAANICDGSIPAINRILMALFPNRGNCYVADNLDKTITYTFAFPLTSVELSIVAGSGVLPKPCGFSATVVHG